QRRDAKKFWGTLNKTKGKLGNRGFCGLLIEYNLPKNFPLACPTFSSDYLTGCTCEPFKKWSG
ncbi:MAG: hypothetical protein K9N62_19905, partial [Verrucomicrobia bacterium]|nr:hypothetical protein [Verrucomicrobiota bacterium]